MTTDLTKTFFDAFGIEPKQEDACELADEYWNNEHLANAYGVFDNYMEAMGCPINKDGCTNECRHAYCKTIYPQVTDHHYLLMLAYLTCCDDKEYGINETHLKEKILEDMIQEQRLDKLAFEKGWESFDGFKTKDFVQALFIEQSRKLKAKEQECEELNKEIHNLNSTIDFIKVTEHSAINKYNKLKQALTEIKEIAEENIRIADLEGLNGVYRRGLAEQIIQKISEVLDDTDTD